MDITIAFMTNYTLDIPNTIKQEQTIESFYKILKVTEPLTTFIFCDEKPLSEIKGKIQLFNNDEYDDYKIPGAMYENKLKNINLHYIKCSIILPNFWIKFRRVLLT